MAFEKQWNVYRTRFLVRARQLTTPLMFTDALGREQSGRPGDYLVETSQGIRRIISQALFEDIYVPLAANQGTRRQAMAEDDRSPAVPVRPPDRPAADNRSRATA